MSKNQTPSKPSDSKQGSGKGSSVQRLVRLADILCTSIEPGHAKQIDEVFPGFYRQYHAAQKRWEEAEENQNFTVRRHRLPNKLL